MRILRVAFSVLLLVCLVTSIIYAVTWDYHFVVNSQDTSGVARTYYPVNLGFGSTALVTSGKMTASGLDTDMKTGGTSIPS
jgi:uncharacterized membrane protein YphA (DoxX/SURF4 family)